MFLSGLILYVHLVESGGIASVLLLIFWAQQLPQLGQSLASAVMTYPALRSTTMRLLEPLGTPDDEQRLLEFNQTSTPLALDNPKIKGASIELKNVDLNLSGHSILKQISVQIPRGCHCAIVGHSGAGKTSMAGLLLGWNKPSRGEIYVEGDKIDGQRLPQLRKHIAWIDPQVQIWNKTLIHNVNYGMAPNTLLDLGDAIDRSELKSLIQKLPEGLNTNLGEGGGFLSEGEGQRVRLARALLKKDAKLVMMDEPFRGLDRHMRKERLQTVRSWWKDSTMIFVTHDVLETLDFDKILVFDKGQIVEEGTPLELKNNPLSKFRELIDIEAANQGMFEDDGVWKRLYMSNGLIMDRSK